MLKRVLLYVVISISPLHALASPFKRNAKGDVLAPVVEMTNDRTGQKILLVGTSHIGPTAYFQATNRKIQDWVGQQPTLVMREFFTCETEVWDITKTNPDKHVLDKISKDKQISFDLMPFLNSSARELAPLFHEFAVKKTPCLLDVDGKTKRPAYYVRRNKIWCDRAKQAGVACQWLAFDVPDSRFIRNLEADLRPDLMKDGGQFASALLFFDLHALRDTELETFADFYTLWERLILEFRDHLAVTRTLKELEDTGLKQAVLPWGAAHIVGMIKNLKAKEFRISGLTEVLFATAGEKYEMPSIQYLLDKTTSPQFEHERD